MIWPAASLSPSMPYTCLLPVFPKHPARAQNTRQGPSGCAIRRPSCMLLAVRSGLLRGAISMNDFSADLRYRLQGGWREAVLVDPKENNNKLATR
eukprot:75313-Pelagomonas_calceolata.AAC.1